MRVVIRTDASLQIGSGHVMRCLTLADALRAEGAELLFVCRAHAGHLMATIARRGHAVASLPALPEFATPPAADMPYAAWLGASQEQDAAETRAALGAALVDWLVVDHYGIGSSWERALRGTAWRVMAIDDLANRAHDCDLLLDQNLWPDQETRYRPYVAEGSTCLLGPGYALLDPLYARLHRDQRPRPQTPRRLFAFFGGVDTFGLSLAMAQAFAGLGQPDLALDLVLSAHGPAAEVEAVAAHCPALRLHRALPSLAPLMAAADFAFGAGGVTTWERLALGLPACVVTVAENQRVSAAELARRGLIHWLGDAEDLTAAHFTEVLQRLMQQGRDALVPAALDDVLDGAGAQRVARHMTMKGDNP